MKLKCFLILLSCLILPAFAEVRDIQPFPNEALKARYVSLIHELRCMVCENQSLSESGSPFAEDLRKWTYERMLSGDSEAVIVNDLTQRYGDQIRYRPPMSGRSLFLWIWPMMCILIAVIILKRSFRRARTGQHSDNSR